jgi:DNA replication and repair protein RecF
LIIQSLELSNFRNIKKATLAFSGTFNVIRGKNAHGKTNLLEALHLFSLGRSFRTRRREEMIMFDEEYLFARLTCESDGGLSFRIEIGLERGGRISVSVNGKKLPALSEIIGIMPTVIFTPEDVALATGPPSERRTFVDYTASQISAPFLQSLKEYRKVLSQRNAALKSAMERGVPPEGLAAWDAMFIERGEEVIAGRRETLSEIGSRTAELIGEVMPGGGPIEMRYSCSLGIERCDTKEALREALERTREQERRRGYTLVGPHYDDIKIFLEDKELKKYGSQGRKRLASIALKLAQARAIMDRRGERPIVLLDDIFSELDDDTAGRLNGLLSDMYQSFITTPRDDAFIGAPAVRFDVQDGVFTGGDRCEQGAE